MPPNRFESEVESFLEGSHGDRTHIKRADHPRLHHYAGRYCTPKTQHARPPHDAHRKRRGLAGQRANAPSHTSVHQAPLVWRAPEGPEGTGGLRGAAPNEVRSPSLAGGRGLRRPEHPWGHTATQPHGTPRRHNKTARPQWGRAAVAVALGFEPRVAVTPHSISSAAPSAARTRYFTRILYYTLPPRAQIDRACWEQGHTAAREQGHTTPRDHTAAHKTGAT